MPLPGLRSKRWDSCIGFPSLAFPYGERDYLRPSLDMNCLLALWPLLFFVSLVTPGKAWSFDLYLKKLSCNMVYILTQNSIKHPYSIRLGSLCSSFSLSLSFCLISWSVKASCITRGILPPFLLSLSYRRLWTTRSRSMKGPQHTRTSCIWGQVRRGTVHSLGRFVACVVMMFRIVGGCINKV